MTGRTLVYLLGPPGAGKTTTLRVLFDGYDRTPCVEGCPTILLHRRPGEGDPGLPETATEIGRDREGGFAGTDALSMSVQPKAVALAATLYGLVVAEGDRLANDRFLQAWEERGWEVRVVYLATPLEEADRRRQARGGTQDPRWVQGRVTKSRRLAKRWGGTPLAGDADPATVAARLAELVKAWHTD